MNAAWQRVVGQHQRPAAVLAALAVINVLAYVAVVRPLALKVATIEDRDRRADLALGQATAEQKGATGALTGKERAVKELAVFYSDVLPADLAGARRVTHLRLAQIARDSGLTFERFTFEPVPVKGSSLTRVKGELVLTGTYAEVRKFVHQVEMSKDFVVLDDLGLAEGAASGSALVVTVKLSTYFRTVTS